MATVSTMPEKQKVKDGADEGSVQCSEGLLNIEH